MSLKYCPPKVYYKAHPIAKLTWCTYAFCLALAWISLGSVLVHFGNKIVKKSEQGTAYVKQLTHDWEEHPMTDI